VCGAEPVGDLPGVAVQKRIAALGGPIARRLQLPTVGGLLCVMPRGVYGTLAVMRHASVRLLVAVLLSACATPYQPVGLEGGYSHTRVGADMFNVVFRGNADTTWPTAENYTLYRCAELTLESGFDYFIVVTSSPDSPLFQASPGSYPSTTSTGRGSYPMVVVTIRAFKGERPSAQAFAARDVLQTLEPSIKRER
jgi:hypothetical protein